MARRVKTRSIIVSRKHARKMAVAVATIAHTLRELSGTLFVLSEKIGTATTPPNLLFPYSPDYLMRMHEILAADAEHLDHMRVFLGHLLYEAPLYSPKAAVAKPIGDGASASR